MDEEALRALADQCIYHPISRSITEVEEAGSAIIELLDRVKALEGIEQERTAWRVSAENAEKDRDDADSMSKALAAVCDKNDARWKFLHTINKDAQGFEWCVMRVKWENGRISEALHTNSDMSDMDAVIESLKGKTP